MSLTITEEIDEGVQSTTNAIENAAWLATAVYQISQKKRRLSNFSKQKIADKWTLRKR